ncbi:autotransporter assembly complex protein TamA [Parablastomonas sp. CN1-191]|uniref:autotransporter assembly complex protein TamA n=1 Tax=Parablastomonas sp. CN1-191 TaxID=3400908 RepID=UPI003BF7E2AF
MSAAALAFALAVSPPAFAQSRDADAELKDLIPDSAVRDPEAWAKAAAQRPDATAQPELPGPDPASPLAQLPGFTLPWPDESLAAPQLADLPPDPDIDQALAQLPARPDAVPVKGEDIRLAHGVTLVFPPADAVPERAEIAARFEALSALATFARSGDTAAQIAARARADKALLEQVLRVYGYYDADVSQSVGAIAAGEARAAGGIEVRFDVAAGPRYRFGAVDLGSLPQTGADYPALREAFGIEPGDPLYTDRIVAARDDLDIELGETGYAFAAVGDPALTVDHRRAEGDLAVPVAPGGKYAFGPVTSGDERFLPGWHLAEIARFKPGAIYRRSLAEDLRSAVLATGLVSSVTITPRQVTPPAGTQPGTVALDVAMTRAPLRTIAGQVGYDSQDGLRVEASWEHRNLFPPEGLLRVRGIGGTREQLLGVTFRRNNFKGRDQVLTVDAFADNTDNQAYAARTVSLLASFEKLSTLIFQKPFTWSVGAQFLLSDERSAAVSSAATPTRTTYEIFALPAAARWDASDSLLDPARGWRLGLSVSPEVSRTNAAYATYARVQLDASTYRPVMDAVILAARARIGTIPGAGLFDLAPSRRFYAGGGGSVRGYGFRAIGPRDAAGNPTGGRSLVEGSVEARIDTGLLGGAIQVVPFLDAGNVSERVTPRLDDVRFGAGVGIRYKTGFGPIRVDVGTPIGRRPGESRLSVTVALGQAF